MSGFGIRFILEVKKDVAITKRIFDISCWGGFRLKLGDDESDHNGDGEFVDSSSTEILTVFGELMH